MARSSPHIRYATVICLFVLVSSGKLGQHCVLAQVADRESEAPVSSREALISYAEAAGFQNSEQFDLAAAEWKNFLTKFAADPRASEARYNLAVCQLRQEKFAPAMENLTKVVAAEDEAFDRLEDAYLNLGWCAYSLAMDNQPKYFAQAAATFQKLLDSYPEGRLRDQALFFGGESLYLQDKLADAVKAYTELVEKHPDSDLHSDAMYALGVAHEDLQQYEAAGKIYARFLKKYSDHEFAVEVRMRKAETVLQAGDFSTAAAMFKQVADTDGFKSVDHARFRQAFCIAAGAEQMAKRATTDPDTQSQPLKAYHNAATIFASVAEMQQSPYAGEAAIAAGRAYFRAKEFDAATKWFRTVKQAHSHHAAEASHWLARILLNDKKPTEARAVIASVLPNAAQSPFLVNLKLDDADALYQTKPTQQDSVDAYLSIAQQHPDHQLAAKALYNAAYGAMELGEYAKGLEYAERFKRQFAGHQLFSEVQKVVAECKLQLGQHEEAAQVYKELAESGDKDATKFELRRGLSLFLRKNYDDAIPVLARVFSITRSADEKAESAYWLGRSYVGKGLTEDAIKAFAKSQQANSEWAQADEVLLYWSRSLRLADQIEPAIAKISQLIDTYPQSDVLDQAFYRLGEFSYAANHYADAMKHYSRVIADWPDSTLVPFSLYGRGWSQLRAGKAADAAADFARLQSEYPKHELVDQTVYAQGMAQHQSGDHEEALNSVKAYLQREPSGSNRGDALYLQGLCLVALDQTAQAIRVFEDLLAEDADYASRDKVLYELAWVYRNTKQQAKSLTTFSRLTKNTPQSPLAAEAHYHLGEDRYEQKQYDEAAEHYVTSGQLAKSRDLREKSAYKLGWARYQSGHYAEAVSAFDQQLQVNDGSSLTADAEFMRGEAMFKQDQFEQALTAYERVRANPPKNETMQVLAHLHGGQAAAQLEQWQVCQEWISELLQRFPDSSYTPQANYELGWAQRNLGELDSALESFRKVTATSRNELGARARFMMGEVLFEQQKHQAAVLEFRRVMFGYGADKAPDRIKKWQAKAAFEAGRCQSVLAGEEDDSARRQQIVDVAKGFFQYVTEKHPSSQEATAALEQLRRLQPSGNRISDRRAPPGV